MNLVGSEGFVRMGRERCRTNNLQPDLIPILVRLMFNEMLKLVRSLHFSLFEFCISFSRGIPATPFDTQYAPFGTRYIILYTIYYLLSCIYLYR